ncbi:hypothetical protein PHMEG_0009907 [Phytophthora megakarya]|uniref:Uncharacterized protein n=1 Tax=Phytophthora megakarya TaxID=4795 RepID=A0A225WFL0_9STRA|nr:hypothetical protein PHMEG_0009907 [Phytophthora megakarya]
MVTVSKSNGDVEKLKRKLRKRVSQAVDAVCVEWARQTPLQQADESMDRSYGSCKKLVAYISDNMDTSPGFVEQMDRIILACFSGASKRVLRTVATQNVWFRSSEEDEEEPQRERCTGPRGHAKPVATSDEPVIKLERVELSATAADGTGLESREVAGSLLMKRPRSRTSKKKLSTHKPLQALVVPETKKAPRRRALSSAEESVDTETDEEEERKRTKKRMPPQKNDEILTPAVPVEDAQGLLTFKEAIGELCYQDRLRETMHKLHRKQLEIKNANQKLRKKNATLDDMNATELSEPGTYADAIVGLESEVDKMEEELVREEAEMADINGVLEQYWATLNEIGIESRHDEIDNFPEFITHYASKKKRK